MFCLVGNTKVVYCMGFPSKEASRPQATEKMEAHVALLLPRIQSVQVSCRKGSSATMFCLVISQV